MAVDDTAFGIGQAKFLRVIKCDRCKKKKKKDPHHLVISAVVFNLRTDRANAFAIFVLTHYLLALAELSGYLSS